MTAASPAPSPTGDGIFDVYVSAAPTDDSSGMISALVRLLHEECQQQRGRPLRVCWDPASSMAPDAWSDRLQPALERSRVLLAILTPDYFSSWRCQRDWERFLELESARKLRGRCLVAAYAITYPPLTAVDSPVRCQRVRDLRRRQPIDVRVDWGGGPRGLEYPQVRATFGAIAAALEQRLERWAPDASPAAACPGPDELPSVLAALPADARSLLEYAVHLPPQVIRLSWLRALVAYGSNELHRRRPKGAPDVWQGLVRRLRSQGLLVDGSDEGRVGLPDAVRTAVTARLAPAMPPQFRSLLAMYLLERASSFNGGPIRPADRAELLALHEVVLDRLADHDFLGVTICQMIYPALAELGEVDRLQQAAERSIDTIQRFWSTHPREGRLGTLLALTYQRRSQLARKAGDEHGEMRYLLRCRETLDELRQRGLPLDPQAEKLRLELAHFGLSSP